MIQHPLENTCFNIHSTTPTRESLTTADVTTANATTADSTANVSTATTNVSTADSVRVWPIG